MSGRPWTPEDVAQLRAIYPDLPTADVAALMGRTVRALYAQAQKIGLQKSPEFFASEASGRLLRGQSTRSRATQFKPGHKTWNKGMKGLDIGGQATRFQPGNRTGRANNLYKPIGTERLSRDGYLERKVHDDLPLQSRWRAVHLLIWEAAHGPLPPGHAVVFRDGDKRHISLDNLELITRADLMRRNTRHNLPKPINDLIMARAVLVRAINRKEKTS